MGVLALIGLGLTVGCRRAGLSQPPEPVLHGCPAPTRGPAYCVPGNVPESYVVGLSLKHGWERGDRIELSNAAGERLAYAQVAEAYASSVKVATVVQRRPADLGGAQARKVPREESLRLGKHFGRVLDIRGGRVRMDLGRSDGLAPGDSYAILGPQWNAEDLGRVRVTEVDDLVAWAVVDVQRISLYPGLEVRFVQGVVMGPAAKVTVLVANFDSDDSSEQTTNVGRAFAKHFAAELAEAAKGMSGWSVRYEETATVRLGVAEEAAHAQAKELGLRHGADLVVWGSMRCSVEACALPRYTAVRPERLGTLPGQSLTVWRALDRGGLVAQRGSTEATALLGTLTFAAQRYGDAAYYLQKALTEGSLGRDDARIVRMHLAYASFTVGQVDQARKVAQTLARDEDLSWRERGEVELARIESSTGPVASARRRLQALAASNDPSMKSHALHLLAMLEAQQGRMDEARRLNSQSLELQRRVGDVQGEAASLHLLADMEAQQGKADQARPLYAQSLALYRGIGNVQGEATSLHLRAVLEAHQGKVDEARRLYTQSLELYRRVGDVKGEASSLIDLASLEDQQHHEVEAHRLGVLSLELHRRIGDLRGEAASLRILADTEMRMAFHDEVRNINKLNGELEACGKPKTKNDWLRRLPDIPFSKKGEARRLYIQSLELERRIGNVKGEATSLDKLARLEAQENLFNQRNRQQYTEFIEDYRRIGDAQCEAVALHQLALLEAHQGKAEEARRLHAQSLKLRGNIGDVEGVLWTRLSLANLDFQGGRSLNAQRNLQDIVASSRKHAYLVLLAEGLRLLGWVELDLGERDATRACWTEAKTLFQQLKMMSSASAMERNIRLLISPDPRCGARSICEYAK